MRIAFNSLAGFKLKAKHLETLLGLASRSAGLETLALIAGFQSYHEVRATVDLQSGAARCVEDVIPSLLRLRPNLSTKGALDILSRLGLFSDVKMGERVPSSRLLDAGLAAPVTPSAVSAFMRRRVRFQDSFTTPNFAAYFLRSVREAQAILNDYVDRGFITYVGLENEVESWSVSRDGMRVFGIGRTAKRLTKKDLKAVESALRKIGPSLATHGVLELSLGGRPAFGQDAGTLVIGARLDIEAYTRKAHFLAYEQLDRVLSAAVTGDYFSLLLFEEHDVPERLRERRILFGSKEGTSVVASQQHLDIDETRHLERFKRLSATCSPYTVDSNFMVSQRIHRELEVGTRPVNCVRSSISYPVNTDQHLQELKRSSHAELEFRREGQGFHSRGYDDAALHLAEVDYAIATNSLERYAQGLEGRQFSQTTRFLARRPAEFGRELSMALILHWEKLARNRALKAARGRNARPAESTYFAVFDGLSYPAPVLVGFVRQPAGGHDSTNHLEKAYNFRLRRLPGNLAVTLHEAGFNAAYVSFVQRAATDDEVAAYKQICKEFDSNFKAILVAGGRPVGLRASYERREEDLTQVPFVLLEAKGPHPVIPKVVQDSWGHHREKNLFDFIATWDPAAQALAARCIIDSKSVQMNEFASRAAEIPCTDVVVLGSGLYDFWKFQAEDRTWHATIGDDDWSVALSFKNNTLQIHITWGDAVHFQTLSPVESEYLYKPYQGTLSALHKFMMTLQSVRSGGLDNCIINEVPGARIRSALDKRLSWLVTLTDYCLNGSLRDLFWGDGTTWPCLQVMDSAED